MRVRWYGQSAFWLASRPAGRAVFIDPWRRPGADAAATVFPDGRGAAGAAAGGLRLDYPPIRDAAADLLLITHEHFDHNGAEAVGGSPRVIRSTAGTLDSPLGKVAAVASEHDPVAGTRRGPNTIFAFALEGLRVGHFGDFGQDALRPEQAAALGRVDLLMVPVGAGPTMGPQLAAEIVRRLRPRWVVPMHYRTPAVNFLDPPDAFLAGFGHVHRCEQPEFDTAGLPEPGGGDPLVVVPAVPV